MRKTGCQIVDGLDLSVQKPLFNTLLPFCSLSKYCYRETSGLKNIRDLLDKLTVGDVLGRNGGSCRCSLSSYGIFKPYVFWTVGQTLGMYNKETLADESNEKIVESLHSFTFRPILFNQNLTKCAVEAFTKHIL